MNRTKSMLVASPLVATGHTRTTKASGPTMLPSVLIRADEVIR
jgi:hypothetical protein